LCFHFQKTTKNMQDSENSMHDNSLAYLGIRNTGNVLWNLAPAELVEETIVRGEGVLADSGAIMVDTGTFTGRSPKDKFVVKDANTENTVWWGDVNNEFSTEKFDRLYARVTAYLQGKELYVRDAYAGADPTHRIKLRVVNENPWHNLFCNNLFLRPTAEELQDPESFNPEWHIVNACGFQAVPEIDGTRQANFTMIDFTKKIILIGGSAYTGEMKKGIFTVLNYLLPFKNVLPMHCSANIGKDGNTAIFFGLSGTGKTTLSADPNRKLIGDDEHGWTDTGIFNFEGGCYAKCVDLTAEKEPQIWNAIRFGALLENCRVFDGTTTVNFADTTTTENTRVAYPIHFIQDAVEPSVGGVPKNIFLLTADAFGVLPPISKLTPGQAMYHFISGYTAKVAGTEAGVTEPQTTFSACFGKAFLPLHPTKYAELLGKKLKENKVNVWLINTGWTGGPYGVGSRMKLSFTRAMITAALNGELDQVETTQDPIFGLNIPTAVPNVPNEILVPKNTWSDAAAYDKKASELANAFNKNFSQYADFANDEIKAAAPRALQNS
jgi:phosphoenolpyruvate carboxykinase (ATP)